MNGYFFKAILPSMGTCFLLPTLLSAQDISGTVVNYNQNPATPVPGLEIIYNGVVQDTTDEQGAFGFPPSSLDRTDGPLLPKEFTLRLFPNPFNPSTILEYTVPQMADVRIEGYNLAGQRIYENAIMRQPAGTYRLTFDASKHNLASGMYFFRVDVGSLEKIIKGVYVK